MAKRDRGGITRRRILEAAAAVFEKEGYQAATVTEIIDRAGVTKGALYFHFPSKEDLVDGIFDSQDFRVSVPPQTVKLQELIDTVRVCAYRLHTETLVRAGFRLALDARRRSPLAGVSPFKEWTADMQRTLRAAESQGELLPHIEPAKTARLCVSAFVGLQLMAENTEENEDIPEQLAVLLCHLLSSIAVPPVLTGLDLSPSRCHVLEEAGAASEGPEAPASLV
ncbi:MAG TPA: ScbR family autoregulator-binding transcription factor [Streptomyces sp.]|nr:ScbR family autoregulator-binding transcription factor [Streptomyces sp.]